MAYNMKYGNRKVSYQDLLSESNQAITDATEGQRKASIEKEKASPNDYKEPPTKQAIQDSEKKLDFTNEK